MGGKFTPIIGWHGFYLLDADQSLPKPPLPNHMPGGYIVRDAVHPGSERTAPVEMRESYATTANGCPAANRGEAPYPPHTRGPAAGVRRRSYRPPPGKDHPDSLLG